MLPEKHTFLPIDSTADSERDQMDLLAQLRLIPKEAFAQMRIFQPQVGCFNRCGFCSQGAGTDIWQFGENDLVNFFDAVGQVGQEMAASRESAGKTLVGYERNHKPGVIYPYLDNDIGSYPHLDLYLELAKAKLGARVRLSTVGYSRHNKQLQLMHEHINSELVESIDAVRFAFTPYTHGYTKAADMSLEFRRDDFVADFANMLRTYKPVIREKGIGKDTACVEIRFNPLVYKTKDQLLEGNIDGHHYIQAGSHLLVSMSSDELKTTTIIGFENGKPQYSNGASHYAMVVSDLLRDGRDLETRAREVIARTDNDNMSANGHYAEKVQLYKMFNADGVYYAVNPDFSPDGVFSMKCFYPRTPKRSMAGYIDSSRYFLNTLLAYKRENGLGRRDEFTNATWEDVAQVLDNMGKLSKAMEQYDLLGAKHLRDNVIPLVSAYREALEQSGLPASYFFSRNFTIDTGQIVNQGRAWHEFRGLASAPNIPMNPREERGFGHTSLVSNQGNIWRWAPSPVNGDHPTISKIGARNEMLIIV